MNKTAIFVEGQTELVIVREYLLKMFDYQNIWLECYSLGNDSNITSVEYHVKNKDADNYFQILDVGNDNAVLTRILKRERLLWASGFSKIIGIRDMYSQNYNEVTKNNTINPDINERFISTTQATLDTKAEFPEKIHFQYAIMETEAWVLGIKNIFTKIHASLTSDYISDKLNIDIQKDDPETTYFHPAKTLSSIFKLIDREYDKDKKHINSIVGYIERGDYVSLSESGKCSSFKKLHNTLFPN